MLGCELELGRMKTVMGISLCEPVPSEGEGNIGQLYKGCCLPLRGATRPSGWDVCFHISHKGTEQAGSSPVREHLAEERAGR